MIIKNNTPKPRTLHYKVNGKIFHVVIPAYGESADIEEITSETQLQLSTYERRLRHIETHLGKSFVNPFGIPSDSEFTKFSLTAAVIGSYAGTISPLSASVSEGENQRFIITLPATTSRTVTVTQSTPTLGTVSPNGAVVTTSVAKLLTFTDDSVGKALVPIDSTSSAYTITNVAANHTLQASFDVVTTARTFSMQSTIVQIPITVSASGGTVTALSGSSSATTATYLNSFSFNGTSFLNSVTGTLSGASSCVVSGITAYTNSLAVGYGYMTTASTVVMSASTNAYTPLQAFTVNGVSKIGDITGDISGETQYVLTMTATTPQVVVATFYSTAP